MAKQFATNRNKTGPATAGCVHRHLADFDRAQSADYRSRRQLTCASKCARLARLVAQRRLTRRTLWLFLTTWLLSVALLCNLPAAAAGQLMAGVAKIEVTDRSAGPVDGPLFVRALVIRDDKSVVAFVSIDVVAIGEIGPIGNDFLPKVRGRLNKELGLAPENVLINASHCHGKVRRDVDKLTVAAVRKAYESLVPVRVGVGVAHEDRIQQNRRIKLKDGREADERHAYAMPPDEEVAGVGPIDPEIGILRIDRMDGTTLAVLFNFACHPIQGVPGGANTSDLSGFAAQVIEQNMDRGTVALFLQGCAGDINPIWYKDVAHPRDAEVLGLMLGTNTLTAARRIKTSPNGTLKLLSRKVSLPLADWSERIAKLEARRQRLLNSLQGTSLNLKTFLELMVKHRLSPRYPSYYAHGYLHEANVGRWDLASLDEENRRQIARYVKNIYVMEELTRLNTNLALLRKHQRRNQSVAGRKIDVEVSAVRIGEFFLVTFPGEPSVEVGLEIKRKSPHEFTFVAGYTNGYIYYAPTERQLNNPGAAQEDCDCMLAPSWRRIYESAVLDMLSKL